jgi:acetylornithine deacetylase/succinyl-diaminopimelate desuccinylase-like protein
MSRTGTIHQHIDTHFDEHLERTKAFVRQPSISSDGRGMKEMADLVAEQIREAGGAAEIVPTEGWPVVYGEVDIGAPKTLLVYGMYDVQPVVGETWDVSDPFGGEVLDLPGVGPSLVNRGIFNSKGPLVGIFNVLQSFREVGEQYPVNLKFIVEGEEEQGSRSLPAFIGANKERLESDFAFMGFYAQDASGKVIMHLGCKGMVFLELIARGGPWGGPVSRGIHSMNAVWFHSPTWVLVQALTSMLSSDQQTVLIDGFYDDIAPPLAEDEDLLKRLKATFSPGSQLEEHDVRRFKYDLDDIELLRKYLFQPSMNINAVESGHTGKGTKTVLPHEAHAKVDIRLVTGMDPERILRLVEDHLASHGIGDWIEIVKHVAYPPAKLGLSGNPAAKGMVQAYRDLGFEPEIWPHSAGVAPFYLFTDLLNIPLAIGGLGHGGRAHSPNEYATVDGMKLYEKSVTSFLVNLGAS